jgi:hypothetical protein
MYIELTPYEQYEIDLRRRQEDHMRRIRDVGTPFTYTSETNKPYMPSPCAHDQCPSCHGTGLTLNGGSCIHSLVCSCPKCSVTCTC